MEKGKKNRKPNGYWTEKNILKEALKFETQKEFRTNYNRAYVIALRLGILDKIFSHMTEIKKPNGYWTEEKLSNEAKKYKSKSEFYKKNSAAYTAALNKKKLIFDRICFHMKRPSIKSKWTKKIVFEEAKKYKTKTEFSNKNSKAYCWASKNKILNDICSHMVRPIRKLKWTKEKAHKEALKYKTRSKFQNDSRNAYCAAVRLNELENICSHMELKYKQWTLKEIKEEANKYKSRIEFLKKGSAAYQSAKRKNILDIVCKHMIALKAPNGYWTEERVLKEALEYETRTKFRIEGKGAYKKAVQLGILERACSHMEIQGTYYKRAIYIIKFPRINSCYIGLTYNYKIRKRGHLKGNTNKTLTKLFKNKEENIWEYENIWYEVSEARKRECELIEQKKIEGWTLLNIAKGGGLGGNRFKWTEKKIFKEAKKHITKSDFHKNSSGAYKASKNLGIFEKACEHMLLLKKSNGHWTKERIIKEAIKYKTKTKFARNNGSAYNTAIKLNILEEVFSYVKN